MTMERWGIFTTKGELDDMIERVNKAGFEIFEVRPLTFTEKMVYVQNDARLFVNEPQIIMFNTTKSKYKRFIRRNKLRGVF